MPVPGEEDETTIKIGVIVLLLGTAASLIGLGFLLGRLTATCT